MNKNSNTTILVLGKNGMLGSMVFDFLSSKTNTTVYGTIYSVSNPIVFKDNVIFFNAASDVKAQLAIIIEKCSPDYIINCIGIIKPWCKDDDPKGVKNAILVNSLFPHLLAETCSEMKSDAKIISIATDCVYSGSKGFYTENDNHDPLDVYGKTKSLGEVRSSNFLNIRCSIIGHELKNKTSLLEWFLSNPDRASVSGYKHHLWNGVTTLQFAEFCYKIISDDMFSKLRLLNHSVHWIKNETVSKYQLLHIFNEVYKRNIVVLPESNAGCPVYRTLASVYLPSENYSMRNAVLEMKNYFTNP